MMRRGAATLVLLSWLLFCASASVFSHENSRSHLKGGAVPAAAAKSDSDLFLGVPFFSGYATVTKAGGSLFYLGFPNQAGRSDPDTPFIIWLSGGPGCSSMFAAFAENGPLTMFPNGTLAKNAFGWNKHADLVFVDQPIETGFSFAKDDTELVVSEDQVARDLRAFLDQFLLLHPTFKNRPFYITGESYAGHYIPAVAHILLKQPIEGLRFVGVAIGNGMVDPRTQYAVYADYALAHDLIKPSDYEDMNLAYKACTGPLPRLLSPSTEGILACSAVTSHIAGDRNIYDIRQSCEKTKPLCYDTRELGKFLRRPDVRQALGAKKQDWQECNEQVHLKLFDDMPSQFRTTVGELLDAGKKVLVYNGDVDLICNWFGGRAWVQNIEWKKREEFNAVTPTLWNVDDQPAGEFQALDNLTFLRVYNAGHMVPMDQPAVALAMLEQWINGGLRH